MRRLFNHYCDQHFVIALSGFPIFDGDGKKLGHVDRVSLGRNSVRIEGWCIADKVALARPAAPIWQRPELHRTDVEAALKLKENSKTGFNIAAHGSAQNLVFSLKSGMTTVQIMLSGAGRWARVKANVHIRARFFQKVISAFPTLTLAYSWPNTSNKVRAKRALGLVDQTSLSLLEPRFFAHSKPVHCTEKLTLIMPVFNAFDVLVEALKRIEENTDLPWRMILVEDCSTDARVRPMLRDWAKRQNAQGRQISLLENAKNRGFIGSVNRAFEQAMAHKDHVVLINSDALVPKDWAQRLIHPILSDPQIASVTPLSNDAEIFNVPFMCKKTDLAPGKADEIDRLLSQNLSFDAFSSAPTGVGFCMALNRKFLQKAPQFDKAFCRGYGEEVDWCCKVSKLGGKHVVQPNLFVEHRGGASFGNADKQLGISRNNRIITERYPKFDRSVQQFIKTDPIRSARIFAALATLSATQNNVDIFIAHSLGGGAEIYLKSKISKANQIGEGVVVLRLGGRLRWRIELHIAGETLCGETNSDALIEQYLRAAPKAHIIYSCAVGDHDPSGLPRLISAWLKCKHRKFTFLVHDYFAISPSYCLLDSDGTYSGENHVTNLDEAHRHVDCTGKKMSSAQWRINWFGLLQNANVIECFSQSSATIMRSAFPKLTVPIEINPHDAPKIEAIKRLTPHPNPSLGILGAIGVQKGADCLQRLSKAFPNDRFQSVTVLGQIDPRFDMGPALVETGRYERSEITALAEQHQIAAWLIPSIWPETFSYTIHEALATELPVFCFDLGAQQEAALSAQNGYVLPLDWATKPELILQYISKVLENDPSRRSIDTQTKGFGDRSATARTKSAC